MAENWVLSDGFLPPPDITVEPKNETVSQMKRITRIFLPRPHQSAFGQAQRHKEEARAKFAKKNRKSNKEHETRNTE